MIKRFLHLADLHIGKKLGDYSLLNDQKNVLEQALAVAEGCDGVFIAGDVYDKPNPSVEAMAVFDSFLTELAGKQKPVYIISGNHDSAGRISYFGKLLESSRITVSAPFSGELQSVSFPEEDNIQIWLLPFLTPSRVREFFKEEKINSYEDAVRTVLAHAPVNPEKINILLAHQFITGGQISEEEFAVGGLDNISSEVFADFDYVALGHLHCPQLCGRKTIRYAGSPLKYSFSEEHQKKSFTVVTVQDKQNILTEQIPVSLPHDVRTIKGTFAELSQMPFSQDYVQIILTDEILVPDARMYLRNQFPRTCRFSIQNSRLRTDASVMPETSEKMQSPAEMFRLFWMHQNQNQEPAEPQMQIVRQIFEELEQEEFL